MRLINRETWIMTKEEFGHISDGIRRDLIALARRFLRATRGPDEAEDIVQEALLALWELSEKAIRYIAKRLWPSK